MIYSLLKCSTFLSTSILLENRFRNRLFLRKTTKNRVQRTSTTMSVENPENQGAPEDVSTFEKFSRLSFVFRQNASNDTKFLMFSATFHTFY